MRFVSFGFQTWGFLGRQALIDRGQAIALALTHLAGETSCKAIYSRPVGRLARDHGIPVHLKERVDTASIDLVNGVPLTQWSSPCAADI